jgi:hypothetical protein
MSIDKLVTTMKRGTSRPCVGEDALERRFGNIAAIVASAPCRSEELSRRFMWLRSRALRRAELVAGRIATAPWLIAKSDVVRTLIDAVRMRLKQRDRGRHQEEDTSPVTLESNFKKCFA